MATREISLPRANEIRTERVGRRWTAFLWLPLALILALAAGGGAGGLGSVFVETLGGGRGGSDCFFVPAAGFDPGARGGRRDRSFGFVLREQFAGGAGSFGAGDVSPF